MLLAIFSNLKRDLAGSGDADLLGRLAGAGALLLDGLHNIHALQHLAKHSVLAFGMYNTDNNYYCKDNTGGNV